MTFDTAIAGACAMAGSLPTDDCNGRCHLRRDVPVCLCVGDSDPMVPDTLARQSCRRLQDAGNKAVHFTVYK
eukprot:3499514-Amphidinium_carterae.1